MVTRAEAVEAAGQVIAAGVRAQAAMSVEDAARAAYTPTGPPLTEIEDQIRAQRTTAVDTTAA